MPGSGEHSLHKILYMHISPSFLNTLNRRIISSVASRRWHRWPPWRPSPQMASAPMESIQCPSSIKLQMEAAQQLPELEVSGHLKSSRLMERLNLEIIFYRSTSASWPSRRSLLLSSHATKPCPVDPQAGGSYGGCDIRGWGRWGQRLTTSKGPRGADDSWGAKLTAALL